MSHLSGFYCNFGGGENWNEQSSDNINQHINGQLFYRPDALPVTQTTAQSIKGIIYHSC